MAMNPTEDRRLHDAMDFIGLRALATAAGMIQICTELHAAGIFDDAAIDRVKEAMAREIALSHRGTFETEFQRAKQRLDALFAGREELRR
jgi:predicted deacylase